MIVLLSLGEDMQRREFITLLGGATAWPFAARAQQSPMPVIGLLGSTSPNLLGNLLIAFRSGLMDTGYVEGRSVSVEYRWAEGQYERLPKLAADLVGRQVAVIVTWGPPAALAAKAATSTIPKVFTSGGDVIKSGLVASLNRPGGNATGVNLFTQAVESKKLDMLSKLIPSATSVTFLLNPKNPAAEGKTKEMEEAARAIGRQLKVLTASNSREIDGAFETLAHQHPEPLIVASDPFYNDHAGSGETDSAASRGPWRPWAQRFGALLDGN
jgi:putative tryptophan/tyrosine transport system substrate-binding protein